MKLHQIIGIVLSLVSMTIVGGVAFYATHGDWATTTTMTIFGFIMWWIEWPFRPYPWQKNNE